MWRAGRSRGWEEQGTGGAGDGRSREGKEGGQEEREEAVVCNGEMVQGREEIKEETRTEQ